MRNNILGGLVIFFVVVTCLLMIDDISSTNEEHYTYETVEAQEVEEPTDLAVLESEE